MIKKNKIIQLFLAGIIILSCWFYFTQTCQAAKLNVEFPKSPQGTTITDTSTPLPIFAKYLFEVGFFLGLIGAAITLVRAGIDYLRGGIMSEYLSSARDKIWGAVSGLTLLFLIYLILTTINPQLTFFTAQELTPIPQQPTTKSPGVYFYTNENCAGEAQLKTSNWDDFGTNFGNKIGWVQIVSDQNNSFYTTLYSSPGLYGKCLDADPNNFNCQAVEKIANSASIHRFDFNPGNNPDNDGVYFYRESSFDPSGGFLKINNSEISSDGYYQAELKNLSFQNVPLEKQICDSWDNQGKCTHKHPPTLAGKEISSVKIAGNYIVYFVYGAPNDPNEGPWSYCQEFPTPKDVNKQGPKQFKFEKTYNQPDNYLPNFLFIYPVKEK